ncbi:MAG: hypothetical protein DRQ78_05415 [Epsilonproteobacteria bacterium]|nr:MAG: hypothetical protein DRQ78_05415 [Campylobacterota bacterium]
MSQYSIPNQLLTLDLNKEVICPLTQEQNQIFNKSMQILEDDIDNNKVLLVYRGENKTRVSERFYSTDLNELINKLFHLGDKGNYFTKSNYDDNIESINDISENVFAIIFDKIFQLQVTNNANDSMKIYFSDKNNKILFLEKMRNLDNKEKIRIRDYYFSYLHIMAADRNKNSIFVSTSKDIDVAMHYAGDAEENQIILYYFIPKPYIDLAIYGKNEHHLKEYCKKNKLPVYNVLYEDEDEVSVKAVLFPHYILGVIFYIDQKKSFIINPYLFHMKDNLNIHIKDGLPIDGEKFEKLIQSTNLNGVKKYNYDNTFEDIRD